MAFPLELTAVLSGASSHQLRLWRTRKILVPEVNAENPALYSYRDVVALRTIAYMRSQTSMQKIGRAFQNLQSLQFTEHPSTYKFGISAGTIFFRTPEGDTVDLSNQAGSGILFTLEDIFQEFSNHRDATVVNFRRPMPHLQVDRGRLGVLPREVG